MQRNLATFWLHLEVVFFFPGYSDKSISSLDSVRLSCLLLIVIRKEVVREYLLKILSFHLGAMDIKELLKLMYGSSGGKNKPVLSENEMNLASIIFGIARDELNPDGNSSDSDDSSDADSVVDFEEKIEATKDNFKRVIELFRKASRAKREFLRNFDDWKQLRVKNTERLKEIAKEIQTDKFNGCIAKIVGGSVGIVGGISVVVSLLVPPLAVVTLPLAIGGGIASALGGGVVVGTAGTEIVLLKNKLDESKTLISEEEANFSRMKLWFEHSQELMTAIEEFVGKDLLKELTEEAKELFDDVKKMTDFKLEEHNKKFMSIMIGMVGKICKSSNIVQEFGPEVAPVIISFVLVFCVVSGHNRIILDCALLTHHLLIGFTSTADLGVGTGRLVAGMAMNGTAAAGKVIPGTVGRAIALGAFVAIGVALDVVNVVLSSIEIHKGAQSSHADEVNHVAKLLEDEYSFLLNVYKELKTYE
ncbi:uncharacterized protein NPIL_309221 [Nephila pilipes]|uniref:Apolipoprotein L3 n=1 Tax=Nephila pilipes TaxID=299642 RepID=A0A8X6TRE8_NEPPI|nr:uncharacterized protein NPIL_309221 [Nephila pilipes]